jgi:hypothetical protein
MIDEYSVDDYCDQLIEEIAKEDLVIRTKEREVRHDLRRTKRMAKNGPRFNSQKVPLEVVKGRVDILAESRFENIFAEVFKQ